MRQFFDDMNQSSCQQGVIQDVIPRMGREGALRRPRRRAQRQATERTPTTSARLSRPFRARTAQRTVPTMPIHRLILLLLTALFLTARGWAEDRAADP